MRIATKMSKKYNPLLLVALVVIVIVLFCSNTQKTDTIISQVDGDILGVARGEDAVIIQLANITAIDIIEEFEIGELVTENDVTTGRKWVYRNDELGEYCFYAYEQVPQYIVLHYNEGILVFNANSVKNTQKVYESLERAWASLE